MPLGDNLLQRLFLQTRKPIPGYRVWNSTLRALHLLSICGLLGGHLFSQPEAVILPWLYAPIISGLALLCLSLYQFNYAIFELSNFFIYLKLILLAMVPFLWSARVELLIIILLMSVLSSHMPKHYRHRRFIPPSIRKRLKILEQQPSSTT